MQSAGLSAGTPGCTRRRKSPACRPSWSRSRCKPDVQSHRAVLLAEVLDALAIRPAGIYVDATFGRGGHGAAILDRLGAEGTLYALDRDPQAIAAGNAQLGDDPRLHLIHASFSHLGAVLAQAGLTERVDGILLDLGV